MRILASIAIGATAASAACTQCPMPPLNITSFLPCLKPVIGEDCCASGRPLVNNPCIKVWLTNPMLAPYKAIVEKARVACAVDRMADCERKVATACPTECGTPSTVTAATLNAIPSPPGAALVPPPAGGVCNNSMEVYTTCQSSRCWEGKCTDGKAVVPGPACTLDCRQGCRCQDGYFRDSNGKCISEAECKKPKAALCATLHEEHTECQSSSCWEAKCVDGKTVETNFICTADCKQGCRCPNGFYRDADGKCVTAEECTKPKAALCATLHEEHTECQSSSCWEAKCVDGKTVETNLICTADCRQGCRCKDGFYRNSAGKCVSAAECTGVKEQKKTPCQIQAAEQVAACAGKIGCPSTQCLDDGSFNPKQCRASTGYCWCVDKEGKELVNTRKGPGQANTVNCGVSATTPNACACPIIDCAEGYIKKRVLGTEGCCKEVYKCEEAPAAVAIETPVVATAKAKGAKGGKKAKAQAKGAKAKAKANTTATR